MGGISMEKFRLNIDEMWMVQEVALAVEVDVCTCTVLSSLVISTCNRLTC